MPATRRCPSVAQPPFVFFGAGSHPPLSRRCARQDGENTAVATSNNLYLDGLGALPETASHDSSTPPADADASIYLWMSDYHPDGGQLFFPEEPIPFVVCLGL